MKFFDQHLEYLRGHIDTTESIPNFLCSNAFEGFADEGLEFLDVQFTLRCEGFIAQFLIFRSFALVQPGEIVTMGLCLGGIHQLGRGHEEITECLKAGIGLAELTDRQRISRDNINRSVFVDHGVGNIPAV